MISITVEGEVTVIEVIDRHPRNRDSFCYSFNIVLVLFLKDVWPIHMSLSHDNSRKGDSKELKKNGYYSYRSTVLSYKSPFHTRGTASSIVTVDIFTVDTLCHWSTVVLAV